MKHVCLTLWAALLLSGGCAVPKAGQAGGGGDYGTMSTTASESRSYRRGRYHPGSRAPREEVQATVDSAPSPPPMGGRGGRSMPPSAPEGSAASTPAESDATPADPASAQGESGKDGAQATVGGEQATMARLIIYRGQVVLQVIGLNDAIEAVQKLALGMGAYLQTRQNNQLVFRVPVEKFQPLVKALEEIGEVAGKSIHAEDVTQQYYDIEVRLKAAEVVLARLKALLDRAKTVEESIAIEREMARVMESIERFKGTLRYLRHHASLSTLTIVFQVRAPHGQPLQSTWRTPFGWVQGLGLWRMMSH